MNIYKVIGVLIITLFFIGCEENKKTNSLKMDLDLVMEESDSIHIYFTQNASVDFKEEHSFWKKVIGTKKNQTISINFPDTIQPKQIRMDFGRNLKQPEIILNEITFSFKEKSFSAKGEEIYHLFRADESNTILNKLIGSLNRKEFNQATGPSLYPKGDKLYNKLSQLYTEK